ncbi:MAG: T9SS type A sorting domain-containing protein [Bacteroidota bacterium]
MLLEDDEIFIFETSNITNGTDPVIHVVNKLNPQPDLSWTDDNGASDGVNAKLTVDIGSHGGFYYVFIRKAGTSGGTCDLKVSVGTSTYFHTSNCAVWGSRIECTKTVTETLNWFTADLDINGDSHIWLEDQTGNPGEIIAYNDDWNVSSGFDWGNNSRIRKNTSTNVRALIVSSHSSYYPIGNCDLYMNCKNSAISNKVSNPNDAIQSAPSTNTYNCIAWSGGIVHSFGEHWFWPSNAGNPWNAYDQLNSPYHELFSFDNYYANWCDGDSILARHTGQVMNFTRMDEYQPWACVALWGDGTNYFEHASVKKPANDQPHGYDWESKYGVGYERLFHPKDKLSGYGSIQWYYMKTGYTTGPTPPTKKSAIIFNTANLTTDELNLMNQMVEAFSDKTRFEELYEFWKNTWDDPDLIHHSNPRMFAKSKQYKALLDYCENLGREAWPLVFKLFLEGEELNLLLIEDLTKKEYLWKMVDILRKQNQESITNHTIPSQRANYIYYIAALLGELEKELEREQNKNAVTDVLTLDQNPSINLYPNPAGNIVHIELIGLQQTEVVLKISDLTGKTLKSVTKTISGDYTFNINLEDIAIGAYICRIEAEKEIRTIRFDVIR